MISAAFISTDYATHLDPVEPNGCTWYRQVLPARELKKLGWDIGVGMPRYLPERGIGVAEGDGAYFGWNITVFKLMFDRFAPDAFRTMQKNGERIVVDVDDFHFNLPESNIARKTTNPHTNAENNRMFFEIGVRAADVVTVSTDFLANFYERRCRDVRIVRNAVDSERFTPVIHDDRPAIGWVGGLWWRAQDVEILKSWLPGFVRDHRIRVHHSGHIPGDPQHFAVRTGLRRVSTVNMKTISKYPDLLRHFHIGLVPLTYNDFNQAKSFLKGLEYAAAGIPFIATPTEEYRILYRNGVGRLADTPDEWRDHAEELLDPDVRREEAERQRAIVVKEFDISTKGERWATALTG